MNDILSLPLITDKKIIEIPIEGKASIFKPFIPSLTKREALAKLEIEVEEEDSNPVDILDSKVKRDRMKTKKYGAPKIVVVTFIDTKSGKTLGYGHKRAEIKNIVNRIVGSRDKIVNFTVKKEVCEQQPRTSSTSKYRQNKMNQGIKRSSLELSIAKMETPRHFGILNLLEALENLDGSCHTSSTKN